MFPSPFTGKSSRVFFCLVRCLLWGTFFTYPCVPISICLCSRYVVAQVVSRFLALQNTGLYRVAIYTSDVTAHDIAR